jgi:methylthioribulose-1-phosphate dehydratase
MLRVIFLISAALCAVSFAPVTKFYVEDIKSMGSFLNERGLCPATSGNLSMRITDSTFAVTASGKHKGELTDNDVILIDSKGMPLNPKERPSAEVGVHLAIYDVFEEVQAVVHHHSLNAVVISQIHKDNSCLKTKGYEIHKAFSGITTHDSTLTIPIFENSQHIQTLANQVQAYLIDHPDTYGFILHGHGFYTWGKDMKEVKHRIEAFEYLLECEYKTYIALKGVM